MAALFGSHGHRRRGGQVRPGMHSGCARRSDRSVRKRFRCRVPHCSPSAGPMICRPTGTPSRTPHGTDRRGSPGRQTGWSNKPDHASMALTGSPLTSAASSPIVGGRLPRVGPMRTSMPSKVRWTSRCSDRRSFAVRHQPVMQQVVDGTGQHERTTESSTPAAAVAISAARAIRCSSSAASLFTPLLSNISIARVSGVRVPVLRLQHPALTTPHLRWVDLLECPARRALRSVGRRVPLRTEWGPWCPKPSGP